MGKKQTSINEEEVISARIPVAEMVVDPDYQGHVNVNLVGKIAKNWNESAAGAVVLNLRDDNTYAVLDGQHRVLAAKQKNVEELSALVFIGKSRKEEAALFVLLNTKHNVSPFDKFRANLAAGKAEEKNIQDVLTEHGLVLTQNIRHTKGIRCLVSLQKIYRDFGAPHLKTTIGAVESAFRQYPDYYKARSGDVVYAVAQFIYRYPEASIKRLIERLGGNTPTTVLGIGAMRLENPSQSLWVGVGKAITYLYNKGMHRESKLYLPMERWDKMTYTPAGKTKMKNATRRVEHLKQYQFKPKAETEQMAAKKVKA